LLERLKIPFALPPDQPTKSYIPLAERMKPESPPLLKDLQELASKHQWKDGLHALTTIRNDIVHSKKNIENLETYLYDASDLGLWYLELVLLAIFDYQGNYHNRLPKYQQNGEKEPVPWSNNN
jgi:histone deacetylase complex regulatory component SIN3